MLKKLKKNVSNIADGSLAVLVVLAIVVLAFGISWIVTCGIIKLITLCFGWTFSWGIATGIWFVMMLLKKVFNVTVTNHNHNNTRW